MGNRKSKPSIPGKWRIVSMTEWDEDYLNEEVEAYIEFEKDGHGSFQFGYVQGGIDYELTERDGKPAVEFSWDGVDGADITPLSGWGWAVVEESELHGRIWIHLGDRSGFVARKKK